MPDPEYTKKQSGKPQRKARYEQIRDSANAQLPSVEHGHQVLEWLHEVGPTGQGMNGPTPLTWQEIAAWKQATETAATREELVMLRQLSSEYVAQYNKSDNPHEPPPTRAQQVDQDALSQQIDSVFSSVTRDRKKT